MGAGHDHDHHGHHHHHHHGDTGEAGRRALKAALFLNGGFLLIEGGVGWWTSSLALLSDAVHMVSDVAAISLALFASHLATRPATAKRTFGLLRAEILGAFLNAVLLVLACIFIFGEAIERLVEAPQPVPGMPVLVVAVVGLAINLGSAAYLFKSGSDNLNIRGALMHMLADALGSVGALVSALAVIFWQWYAADAVVGIITGVLVLWGTWGILRDSTAVLLEFAPRGLDQDVITEALLDIDGVAEVHDLHIWRVGGTDTTVTAHLVPEGEATAASVLRAAEAVLLERFEIDHSTIQIDPADGDPCRQQDCTILAQVGGHGH